MTKKKKNSKTHYINNIHIKTNSTRDQKFKTNLKQPAIIKREAITR